MKTILSISLLLASISSFADTYVAGKYQDLSLLPGLDKEAFTIPLNSIDRFTMTAQALVLQKKMSQAQRIKSISEIVTEDDFSKPNTEIKLANEISGECTSLKAIVLNGYMDENGNSSTQMNTSVKFVGTPKRCK